MSDDLVLWLLPRIAVSPDTTVSERELRQQFGRRFEQIRHDRLLRLVQAEAGSATHYESGDSCPRDVATIGGHLWGVCTCSEEHEPVPLTPAALRRYAVDRDELAARLREANALGGRASTLSPRFVYLGERVVSGRAVAWVLALIREGPETYGQLVGLAQQLPRGYDAVLVLTPTFEPDPLLAAQLEAARVFVRSLLPLGGLHVAADTVIRLRPAIVSEVVLTAAQEQEFKINQYNSRLPIHFTGRTSRLASTQVIIGGQEVSLEDASFALFFRLACQLLRDMDGSVFLSDLVDEGYVQPCQEHQAKLRLRRPLEACLGGLGGVKFIEVKRPKAIRLSTHPAFLSFERDLLLHHRDHRVQKLALELGDSVGNAWR